MNFNGINTITGEYTCGYSTNFSTNKPTLYSRNSRPDNNWFSATSWTTNSDGSNCSSGCSGGYATVPNGNPVVILAGNTISLNSNSATAYSVDIEGTLDVGTTTDHSLGHISGPGTLKLTSTSDGMFVLPGGEYNTFMANTASTIQFAGNNTATLPLKPGNIYKPYQNVLFTGTGMKEVSAENIKVNGNLTISSGTVLSDALFNMNVYVLGNWVDQNTTINGFIPGTGMTTMEGSTLQQMNVGKTENFWDLTINNASNVTLRNSTSGINLLDKLYLTNGNLLTATGQPLTISNTASTGVIVGGGSNSFVDGPMLKNIISGQSFTFPSGNLTRYEPITLSSTSASASPAYWTVTAIDANPSPTYLTAYPTNLSSPLTSVSNNEYWVVGKPTGGSANVSLYWDASSYPGVTGDPVARNYLRVAEYDGTSLWNQEGQSVNASASSVSTTTPVSTNNFVFTFGLAGVTATLTSSSVSNICNNGAIASIPVSLTGMANWTLTYKITNNATFNSITFPPTILSSSSSTIHVTGTDVASIAQAGVNNTYTLTLVSVKDNSNATGICSGSTQFTILFTNTPSITGTFTVGTGETRTYSTTLNGSDTYSWDWNGGASGGTITPSNNTASILIGAAGTYQLRVQETTAASLCVASAIQSITVNSVPSPSITPRTANICQGSTIGYSTPSVGTHTYSWAVVGGTPASGTGNTITVTWNTTGAGNISVVENNGGTKGYDTVKVVVSQSVTTGLAVTAQSSPICSGTGTNIQVASSQLNMDYQLYNGATAIGNVVVGTGGTINLPTGNLTTTTTFTVQASNNACSANLTQQPTVTVNPVPAVTNLATASTCSGTGPNISLTASAPSTFAWTIGTITGGITGASAGSGNTINQTLTDPSNATSGTVQYIVTPTSTTGSCAGSPYTITITVNPVPAVTNLATASTCSGTGPNISLTASAPSSFAWTIGTITGGITGASAGSGNTINQTLTDPSNATSGTVQYIVTPTSTTGSCAGSPYTITITVNPVPAVTNLATASTCSGTGPNISLTASAPSTFAWTIGTITGGITGASAGSGSTINQTLTDPSNATSGTVQYIVTPTSTTGSCAGSPYTITITVNPLPAVTNSATASTCSGTGPNISLTANAPSSFAWTIGTITGGITGASAGSGSTINQTLTDPSNATSGTVQYIVTPTSTTGSCAGSPYTITITVNPVPAVTNSATASTCSGTGPNISLTASAPSSFAWTIGTITGGITGASAGSGSTINQTLTDPSNATSGTVQYIVTPTSTAGSCTGSPFTITVTVNPMPDTNSITHN